MSRRSASQTERISILRLALQRKGLADISNPHYDLPNHIDPPALSTPQVQLPRQLGANPREGMAEDGVTSTVSLHGLPDDGESADDHGVYL